MSVTESLEPKEVFKYFEEISAIPRPSFHEEKISEYLVNFAKEHNFEHYTDDLHNVIMIKEASEGYEDVPPIILQGHMDMVCEKDPGVEKDMEKEGLDLYVDGDFLKAKGTTLGGDDGVAIAYALSLLTDETLKHPRLEFVCTVSEEVGMEGATGLDVSMLKGKKLLNIDSEGEGEVLTSCAGGGTAQIALPVKRERDQQSGAVVELKLSNLAGGHSGMEIDKGHGNATLLMARFLVHAESSVRLRLIEFKGGSKDNAIPREAYAKIILPYKKEVEILKNRAEHFISHIKAEYGAADPDVTFELSVKDESEWDKDARELTRESTDKVLAFLSALPNGVIRMSDVLPGMTETSLNLGITNLDKQNLNLGFSVRSSKGSAYRELITRIAYLSEYFGAKVDVKGEYPAWEYAEVSPLRDTAVKVYKEMFGKDLKVVSVHAGVECGILSSKIPGLSAIAMGPDIFDIHTPKERLSISSTKRTYEFVRNIIEAK